MQPGHLSQVQFRCHDVRASAHFFASCFSWRINIAAENYATIDTGAAPMGELYQIPAPQVPIGVAPFVLVEDIAASFEKAVSLGGRPFIAPTPVPGGVFANVIDPGGAEISLLQSEDAPIEFAASGANPFIWLEKPAPDLAASVGFYSGLFGWEFSQAPGVGDFAYHDTPDRAVGIGLVSGARGAKLHGNTIYVRVHDAEAVCKVAAESGGAVITPPQTSAASILAIIADPSGNKFAVTQPLPA